MTEASTKQQIQDADERELNSLIAETIRVMNQRPGANPTETGEIIHRVLKSARDIQGEKNGLLTKDNLFGLQLNDIMKVCLLKLLQLTAASNKNDICSNSIIYCRSRHFQSCSRHHNLYLV